MFCSKNTIPRSHLARAGLNGFWGRPFRLEYIPRPTTAPPFTGLTLRRSSRPKVLFFFSITWGFDIGS